MYKPLASEQKICEVMKRIRGKAEIAPQDSSFYYRAGHEGLMLSSEDEILILNKLASEGIIEILSNAGSEGQ